LNWFEETDFIASALDNGNEDPNPLMEIFTLKTQNTLQCTPAGIMQELLESYMFDDSPLKDSGWASNHYYMTRYIKEW
jgi:hypothetical protein